MNRRIVAWNIFCGVVTALLIGGLTPRLINHFTAAPFGRPLWRDSWSLSFEGIFIVMAIAVCGIAMSSLFAGRILRVRRVVAAILAAGVLGAWIYSGMLSLEKAAAYSFERSMLSEMMQNDGMGFGAIALAFLLVAAVSGCGISALPEGLARQSISRDSLFAWLQLGV